MQSKAEVSYPAATALYPACGSWSMEVNTATPMALMRRYVVDYTNGHDLTVVDELMSLRYRLEMGGEALDLSGYKAMVQQAFEHFPDLALTVHDICWSGRRVAMRFSESATSPRHGTARAVWPGIALYRLDGEGRLASCRVEQDFYGRYQQLVSQVPATGEPPHPSPWSTEEGEQNVGGEALVRAWLAARDQSSAEASADFESSRLLSGPKTRIDDMFSAGDRIAAKLTIRGKYAGGLAGVDNATIGAGCHVDVTALFRVSRDRIDGIHMVADRFGLRRRLRD